jgi:hypothetical protein
VTFLTLFGKARETSGNDIFLTEKCKEKAICFAGEFFYAKKGIKTTQFWGAVHAENAQVGQLICGLQAEP